LAIKHVTSFKFKISLHELKLAFEEVKSVSYKLIYTYIYDKLALFILLLSSPVSADREFYPKLGLKLQ